jgi:predicted nucleotidyltransferase
MPASRAPLPLFRSPAQAKLLTRLFVVEPDRPLSLTALSVYGSWARQYEGGDVPPPRDLDVLVVGEPNPNAVYAAARRAEEELDLEVNPLIVSVDEWEQPRGIVKRVKAGPLVALPLRDAA